MPDLSYEIKIDDPIIKRNYDLVGKFLIRMVDDGLNHLKHIYVRMKGDSSFQEFAADNYFEYVLRDYLRKKIRAQIKFVLKGAVLSLEHFQGNTIDPYFLDDLVEEISQDFREYDLIYIHSDHEHPAFQEIKLLSNLTYRVSVIQAGKLLRTRDPDISNIQSLIRATFSTMEDSLTSVEAIFSMFDQIIDLFERNLDTELIDIAFYKPTYRIRDFVYARQIYEYAIEKIKIELQEIYENTSDQSISEEKK